MQRVKIVATGLYLPPRIQTAKELSPLLKRSEKWIISRTGVAERRIAEEPMDVMAAKAARDALGDGPAPDCILNASATPLQLIPDSAPFIERALGLSGIPAWSIHSTCLSFLVALNTAAALITAKVFKRILIVSSENGTPFRDFDDPESAALFGDGAAAAIIEPTPDDEQSAYIDWEMNTWPEGAELTEFRGAGTKHPPNHPSKTTPKDNLFQMKGAKVYRMARDKIKENLDILYGRNNVTPDDFDWLIMHQASGRAVQMAGRYGYPPEKTVNIAANVGNTIAASIPMVLATAEKRGLLKRGDLLLLGGTGAGLSVAFSIIRW
ncbi:ketoacyl-ACP synthase III [candidate division KSB1 bacterium]|nr:ketoacyl-ACP synthase III [candidate division KSB1 bacterium]